MIEKGTSLEMQVTTHFYNPKNRKFEFKTLEKGIFCLEFWSKKTKYKRKVQSKSLNFANYGGPTKWNTFPSQL